MITNEDLLKELSQKELIELSDLRGSKDINQDVVDDAKSDALSYIGSFILIPSRPTLLLKQVCVLLTIIELKRKQNFPKEAYEQDLKKCDELLLKMASKKLPTELGDDKEPKQKIRAFVHKSEKMDLEGLNG